jgi:hypothetical protein
MSVHLDLSSRIGSLLKDYSGLHLKSIGLFTSFEIDQRVVR